MHGDDRVNVHLNPRIEKRDFGKMSLDHAPLILHLGYVFRRKLNIRWVVVVSLGLDLGRVVPPRWNSPVEFAPRTTQKGVPHLRYPLSLPLLILARARPRQIGQAQPRQVGIPELMPQTAGKQQEVLSRETGSAM